MRHAPGIVRIRHILLARDLLASGDVPQTEFGFEASVTCALTAAGDDELRVDDTPCIHLRRLIGIRRAIDEALRIDRLQKHRAREIVGDDVGERVACVRVAAEICHRDHDRAELSSRPDVQISLLCTERQSRDERTAQKQPCH